jgi:hypothetical protein
MSWRSLQVALTVPYASSAGITEPRLANGRDPTSLHARLQPSQITTMRLTEGRCTCAGTRPCAVSLQHDEHLHSVHQPATTSSPLLRLI